MSQTPPTRIDTGGLAFPRTGYYPDTSNCRGDIDALRERMGACTDPEPGMTLRDYFAAKAMQAYLAADPQRNDNELSRASFAVADAMLATRKPKPSGVEVLAHTNPGMEGSSL